MIQKIKIKGWEFHTFGYAEKGEFYIGYANGTVALFEWKTEAPSDRTLHIFKRKEKKAKKPKWIEATAENVKALGYEWGEGVPCRVRDDEDEDWNTAVLIKLTKDDYTPFGTTSEWCRYCQLRNKRKGE